MSLPFTNQIDDFYQHLKLMKKAKVTAERGHARLAKGPSRFQGDTQWQQAFRGLVRAYEECREHTAAGCQLRDAGVYDEARYQLELADEAKERTELIEHSLRDLDLTIHPAEGYGK